MHPFARRSAAKQGRDSSSAQGVSDTAGGAGELLAIDGRPFRVTVRVIIQWFVMYEAAGGAGDPLRLGSLSWRRFVLI